MTWFTLLCRARRALVQSLACDRDQARVVLGFVRAFFDHIPPLGAMVTRSTASGLERQNDVDIVIARPDRKGAGRCQGQGLPAG